MRPPICTDSVCSASNHPWCQMATATIWRYRCDPEATWNVTVYAGGNATSYQWRSIGSLELGNVIDLLASPQTRRLLGVEQIMIDREHLPRRCREIECDDCHGV